MSLPCSEPIVTTLIARLNVVLPASGFCGTRRDGRNICVASDTSGFAGAAIGAGAGGTGFTDGMIIVLSEPPTGRPRAGITMVALDGGAGVTDSGTGVISPVA